MTNTKPRSKMSPSQRYWPVYLDKSAEDGITKNATRAGLKFNGYLVALHEMFGEEFIRRTAKV